VNEARVRVERLHGELERCREQLTHVFRAGQSARCLTQVERALGVTRQAPF
jgi:hypothetical protein